MKKGLLAIFFMITCSVSSQQVIVDNTTPSTLMTNSTINYKVASSTVSFSDNGTDPVYGIDYVIDEVVVDISNDNPYISQYDIILISPEGTEINLETIWNLPSDFDQVRYVNRECADGGSIELPSVSGSFYPDDCAAGSSDCFDQAFDNESLNGQWKL